MNESDIKSIKLDVRTSFRLPKGLGLLSQEEIEVAKKSAEYEISSNDSSPYKQESPPKSKKSNDTGFSKGRISTSQSKQKAEKKNKAPKLKESKAK